MPVAVDEAGDGELPVEIDDLGLGTDVLGDRTIASHGEDPVATHRDRLAFRNRVVHSDDLAASEHEIGDLGLASAAHHHGDRAAEKYYDQRATPEPQPPYVLLHRASHVDRLSLRVRSSHSSLVRWEKMRPRGRSCQLQQRERPRPPGPPQCLTLLCLCLVQFRASEPDCHDIHAGICRT